MPHDERSDAGDEWTAKALLMGATLRFDRGYGSYMLWAAELPGKVDVPYYGVTQARACRKLVRAVLDMEQEK